MARPTKYRAEFADRAIELMRNGASLCEIAADLGISFETLNTWRKDGKHKHFAHALDLGDDLARAWWEKLRPGWRPRHSCHTDSGMDFFMKNCYNWTDKRETEVTGKGGAPIAINWPLPKTELDES